MVKKKKDKIILHIKINKKKKTQKCKIRGNDEKIKNVKKCTNENNI